MAEKPALVKVSETYRKHLVKMVKAAGEELAKNADKFVGHGDLTVHFKILLDFPQISDGECPTITVTQQYISDEATEIQLCWGHEEKPE